MILDTNVVSEIMRPAPDPRVIAWFRENAGQQLYLTAITEAELLYGVGLMPPGKRRIEYTETIKRILNMELRTPVLPFESADASFFAMVAVWRRQVGRPVAELDAQIAAIALRRGLPIATRNVRDFEDCGVTLINPWDPAP